MATKKIYQFLLVVHITGERSNNSMSMMRRRLRTIIPVVLFLFHLFSPSSIIYCRLGFYKLRNLVPVKSFKVTRFKRNSCKSYKKVFLSFHARYGTTPSHFSALKFKMHHVDKACIKNLVPNQFMNNKNANHGNFSLC